MSQRYGKPPTSQKRNAFHLATDLVEEALATDFDASCPPWRGHDLGLCQRDTSAWLRRALVFAVTSGLQPITARYVYYRIVGIDLSFPKTESTYGLIADDLGYLRFHGLMPYSWLIDETRELEKVLYYNSVDHCLQSAAADHWLNPWRRQATMPIVWTESQGAASKLRNTVINQHDAMLMASRGFNSMSAAFEIGRMLKRESLPVTVIYLGDHDPDGECAAEHVERELRRHGGEWVRGWRQIAVLPEQIERWRLTPKPTKDGGRSEGWDGVGAVEVEAIDLSDLQELVSESVLDCRTDPDAWHRSKRREQRQRTLLSQLADAVSGEASLRRAIRAARGQ